MQVVEIVDVKVTREKPYRGYAYVRLFDNGLWKAWPPVPNPLPLVVTSGKWQWRPGVDVTTKRGRVKARPDVLLMDDRRTKYVLWFIDVPVDFFKQACDKTLSGYGYVANANQDDDRILYVFMSPACNSQDTAGATDDDDDE
jgi:hypothetical protein